MSRKLSDWNGVWIEQHAHVKIRHPRHAYHGRTGTIVRWDLDTRRVWVQLPGGITVAAASRSIEVMRPHAK